MLISLFIIVAILVTLSLVLSINVTMPVVGTVVLPEPRPVVRYRAPGPRLPGLTVQQLLIQEEVRSAVRKSAITQSVVMGTSCPAAGSAQYGTPFWKEGVRGYFRQHASFVPTAVRLARFAQAESNYRSEADRKASAAAMRSTLAFFRQLVAECEQAAEPTGLALLAEQIQEAYDGENRRQRKDCVSFYCVEYRTEQRNSARSQRSWKAHRQAQYRA